MFIITDRLSWWRGRPPRAVHHPHAPTNAAKNSSPTLSTRKPKIFGGAVRGHSHFFTRPTRRGRVEWSQHGTKTLHAQARSREKVARGTPSPYCFEKPAHARCEVFTSGRPHNGLKTIAKTRHNSFGRDSQRALPMGIIPPNFTSKAKAHGRPQAGTNVSDSRYYSGHMYVGGSYSLYMQLGMSEKRL